MAANSTVAGAGVDSGLSLNSPGSHFVVNGGSYSNQAFVFKGNSILNSQGPGIAVGGSINYVMITGVDTTGNATSPGSCTSSFGNAGVGISCGSSITNSNIGGNQ